MNGDFCTGSEGLNPVSSTLSKCHSTGLASRDCMLHQLQEIKLASGLSLSRPGKCCKLWKGLTPGTLMGAAAEALWAVRHTFSSVLWPSWGYADHYLHPGHLHHDTKHTSHLEAGRSPKKLLGPLQPPFKSSEAAYAHSRASLTHAQQAWCSTVRLRHDSRGSSVFTSSSSASALRWEEQQKKRLITATAVAMRAFHGLWQWSRDRQRSAQAERLLSSSRRLHRHDAVVRCNSTHTRSTGTLL